MIERIHRFALLVAVLFVTLAWASAQHVLQETFDDLDEWDDLSTAVTWSPGGSVFETVNGILSLSSTGGNVSNYTSTDGLKTFTAIDHQFASPVDRETETVILKTRLRWPTVESSSGEGNRFNITYIHDYPVGGLDLTPDAKLSDASEEWWARPAYQIRIRGSNTSNGPSILQYGGGNSIQGEWEYYGNGPWWIPGFNSAPGGGSPGSGGKGWTLTDSGIASDAFQTFTYIVGRKKQWIYVDGVLRGQQTIDSNSDGNPSFYEFPKLEGIRLYWRGSGDVEVDWLTITKVGAPEATMSIVSEEGQDYLAITYNRLAGGLGTAGINYSVDGVSWVVESSSTLSGSWQSGATVEGVYDQVVQVGSASSNGDGTDSVTVRLGRPTSADARQFMRVKQVIEP